MSNVSLASESLLEASVQVSKTKVHFNQLDALRGICALLVAIYHFPFGSLFLNGFTANAYLFVDFFFVLSGFVMQYNYGDMRTFDEVKRFVVLRFFRLYPLHLFMLLVFLGYEIMQWGVVKAGIAHPVDVPFSVNNLSGFVLNLLLLNRIIGDATFNFASWSICAEFWTYLIFAAVVIASAGARRHRKAVIYLAIGVCCYTIIFILAPGLTNGLAAYGLLSVVRCAGGFFLGAGLCACLRFNSEGKVMQSDIANSTLQSVFLIGTVVMICLAGHNIRMLDYVLPTLFIGLIYSLVYWPNSTLAKLAGSRSMQLLGVLSYSIYMTHEFIVFFACAIVRFLFKIPVVNTRMTIPEPWSTLLGLGLLIVVVFVSYFTYSLIEKPGQQLGRKLSQKPQSRVA